MRIGSFRKSRKTKHSRREIEGMVLASFLTYFYLELPKEMVEKYDTSTSSVGASLLRKTQ